MLNWISMVASTKFKVFFSCTRFALWVWIESIFFLPWKCSCTFVKCTCKCGHHLQFLVNKTSYRYFCVLAAVFVVFIIPISDEKRMYLRPSTWLHLRHVHVRIHSIQSQFFLFFFFFFFEALSNQVLRVSQIVVLQQPLRCLKSVERMRLSTLHQSLRQFRWHVACLSCVIGPRGPVDVRRWRQRGCCFQDDVIVSDVAFRKKRKKKKSQFCHHLWWDNFKTLVTSAMQCQRCWRIFFQGHNYRSINQLY